MQAIPSSKDNVRLSSDKVLGDEGHGLQLAGKWLGMGRIWVGATCCGKAELILSMATEWAANRKQFGKPFGTFQATGFRLADGSINLRAADLMVKDAVSRVQEGPMSDAYAAEKTFAESITDPPPRATITSGCSDN